MGCFDWSENKHLLIDGSEIWILGFFFDSITKLSYGIIKDKVWGVAYQLPEDQINEIKARLDEREKRYQTALNVPFHFKQPIGNDSNVLVTCYVAPLSGPLFLGEANAEIMAEQIKSARGPSGDNLDYLAKVWEFMRDEVGSDAKEDVHLATLYRLCFP